MSLRDYFFIQLIHIPLPFACLWTLPSVQTHPPHPCLLLLCIGLYSPLEQDNITEYSMPVLPKLVAANHRWLAITRDTASTTEEIKFWRLILFEVYAYAFVCVGVCASEYRCLQRPEEKIKSPGSGATGQLWGHPECMPEAGVLNHSTI